MPPFNPGVHVPCNCGATMALHSFSVFRNEALFTCVCGCTVAISGQLLQQSGLWTPPEPEKPAPPEPEQTIHGSVIGYRAWRICEWQLFGTGVNRAWVPGVNEATCDPGPAIPGPYGITFTIGSTAHAGPAPALGCDCGITALARFAEKDDHWSQADVYGAIEAWSEETAGPLPGEVAEAAGVETNVPPQEPGRFILHGTGFRAQFGKVVLLAVDDDWPVAKKAAVRALAREHEADVCKRSHLEDAAKEHGQLVPDEMLEWAQQAKPEAVQIAGTSHIIPYLIAPGTTLTITPPPRPLPAPPASPRVRKGIALTLGYPGPPADPTSKFTQGQRVKDSKGTVWACVKGGKPGLWEMEQ